MRVCYYCDPYHQNYLLMMQQPPYQLPIYQMPIYQLTTPAIYQPQPQPIYQPQLQAEIDPTKLEIINDSLSTDSQFYSTTIRLSTIEFGYWNYLSFLITPENTQPNNLETNQHPILTSNILPAIITENKSLNAIFLFELKELSIMPLFSGAALEEKPITAMYTNAKVDGHSIKLILDSRLAGSIITKQLMDQLGYQVDHDASAKIITTDGATKTPIGEINNFLFEVNSIFTLIKVLVIEATQYQALVDNDWLSKTNTTNSTTPLIKLEEEKEKPTWEAYQVFRADKNHNELPPILFWNDNGKEKQKETELI
ncbi:hypothetical protein G9A89_014550 [Geosiphon pyriformis]|nr:hypothetical protein G9A89_014550 [Geosiphon pyriformis]